MKVSSLVDSLKSNFMSHFRGNFVQKRYDGRNKHQMLADYETQLTFTLFEKALHELESKGLDTEVTPEIIDIILKELNDRWSKRTKNTDLCYTIALHNVANIFCLSVAKNLASIPGLIAAPSHHYPLLMPSIKSWHDERSHSNILNKSLHEFQVSDDATFVICLEYVRSEYVQKIIKGEKNPYRLFFYVKPSDRQEVELSHAEAMRIVLHSQMMMKYYEAVAAKHQKTKTLDESKAKGESNHHLAVKENHLNKVIIEERELREKMIIAIRDNNYQDNGISSSYGDPGVKRLQENLLPYVNDLFTSRDQFLEYALHMVRRDQWHDFINRFDYDVLLNLLSPKAKSIDAVLADTSLFSAENVERYGRFIDFCLLKAYWSQRAKGPEYDSYSARFLGKKDRSSREVKEKVVKLLMDAVENPAPISMESIYDEAVKQGIVTALVNDTVGEIYKRMCEIHRPVAMEVKVGI